MYTPEKPPAGKASRTAGRDRPARPLRICVTGAECTGKTTLALELARHYRAPMVREYTRDYFSEKLARGDASVHTADILKVIAEQARREDQAAAWTGPLIICDTDVFTVTVWYPIHVHERRPEIDRFAQDRRDQGKGIDLYLLCPPDFPFQPDEIRTSGRLREDMHPTYRERLAEAGCRFVEVGGPPRTRLASAVEAIDELVAEAERAQGRS